ncbi:DNA replication factor Cdt1 isoform X2 [Uranotaenia lowii]|uniref:DNA replication factor Cdt1 isoform X2 n=1 Tax=Uranotaenia lowii TaxID=190385 RepID=UPI00247AB492|nr:DNA replication factor Cdt1 isoform X2 [Uranotaenia lowii]
MSQPTVAAYFNTRKRVAADDVGSAVRNKNAVVDAGNEPVGENGTPESRRVTRATRNIKRIGAVTVDEKTREMLEQPKLVKFLKMGNLSPKKKLSQKSTRTPIKSVPKPEQTKEASPTKVEFSSKNNANNVERGMKTPTKQVLPNPAPSKDISSLTADEVKTKLSRSARLTELKTKLNKLQSGFDKLDRMEKVRLEETKQKPVPPSPSTAARNLKEFQSLEVEVPVSPQKVFTSPTKMLHRTPTKAAHSSLMSPHKAVTPKRLSALMSPIKEPTTASPVTASPTKVPAYQRFQTLAESGRPALQLPYKYRCLAELFKCIDTVCAMFYNRKEQITFKKLKPAVQRMARKNLYESHLAQIKNLFPEAFTFSQDLTKNYGSVTKYDTYQLVIKPNVEEKTNVKTIDEETNVIRNAQNQAMNPQVMILRIQKFNRILLERAKDAHDKFLRNLDPPMIIAKNKLTRWHPEFDLESCPDVEQTPLPIPPNVERFSTAKDVLSTARNLFNCNTPMERALERLEQKKRQENAETVTSQTTAPATTAEIIPPAPKQADPFQSALKNVPQSLLEKIRAKQAAKALDQMTRRPSQEQEAIKYGRLPEIARHLRNVFVTERKGVLPLETALLKIENSYRGNLTVKDLEEHLKLISQQAPFWLTLTEVRKTMYAKIAKDCDLGKVTSLLEKKANELLKC